MISRKYGKVLNLASTAAFQPGPTMAVYFATKAYVLHFSEAIANELGGTGVTVTALCPGGTASGFQAAANVADSPLFKGKKLPTSAAVALYGYKGHDEKEKQWLYTALKTTCWPTVSASPRVRW